MDVGLGLGLGLGGGGKTWDGKRKTLIKLELAPHDLR